MVADHWLHTFAISLPNIDALSASQGHAPYCNTSSRTGSAVNRVCTDMAPMVATLNELRNKSTNHLYRVIKYVDQLLPHWRQSRKRSLGSWLGSGIAWTFGLAKQTDVDKIQHTVQHMASRMNIALNSWHKIQGDMRSYTLLNNARMDNLARAENETAQKLIQMHSELLTARTEVRIQQALTNIISKSLLQYVTLEDDFIMFYMAILEATHSRLSPVLVPPEALNAVIHSIRSELRRNFPRYMLASSVLRNYYQMSDFL